jgi:hypothetical protein
MSFFRKSGQIRINYHSTVSFSSWIYDNIFCEVIRRDTLCVQCNPRIHLVFFTQLLRNDFSSRLRCYCYIQTIDDVLVIGSRERRKRDSTGQHCSSFFPFEYTEAAACVQFVSSTSIIPLKSHFRSIALYCNQNVYPIEIYLLWEAKWVNAESFEASIIYEYLLS